MSIFFFHFRFTRFLRFRQIRRFSRRPPLADRQRHTKVRNVEADTLSLAADTQVAASRQP